MPDIPAPPIDPAAARRDVELARKTVPPFAPTDGVFDARRRCIDHASALADECDRLRRDAARLEFLERRECRMQAGNHGVKITFELPFAIYTAETLREAIDAAMGGER